MSSQEIVTPIIHLNGTSADELIRVRSDAYDALSAAFDAIKQMAPNGRDYYPEPGRMERAVNQHERRMRMLTDLMNELAAECNLIEKRRVR